MSYRRRARPIVRLSLIELIENIDVTVGVTIGPKFMERVWRKGKVRGVGGVLRDSKHSLPQRRNVRISG